MQIEKQSAIQYITHVGEHSLKCQIYLSYSLEYKIAKHLAMCTKREKKLF